jgi:hypothetical protein
MTLPIDHSLYPDFDVPPDELPDDFSKADYVQRVCAAWDFGVMPDRETFDMFSTWRDVFDRFPVSTSPAYHTFRSRFNWPAMPWPIGVKPPTPRWEHLDRIEGRDADPCERFI